MKLKKQMKKISSILSALTAIAIWLTISATETGCANIIPPTGGPRDSLPPVLLNVTPKDSTLNFKSKKVVLNFDEFVQLDKIQENLLVSPTPKINPVVEAKLRTVTITIKDTLQENTTYSFDFGKAIRDVNESNILKDFTYLLSTGSTLDSLQLSGNVIVAETGKVDSTLIVMLYDIWDDSAVVKERPKFIARLDTLGNFRFRNLPPDTFAVYAMKDDGAKRYLSKKQLFGYSDSLVTSASQKSDIMLYVYLEKDTGKQTSTLSLPPSKKPKGNADRILKFQSNISDGQLDLLSNPEFNFIPDPIETFDTTRIILKKDSTEVITNYYIKRDTSNKKFTVMYKWLPETTYHLELDTLFAIDTSGRKILRNDTLSFTTKKVSEYGFVKLRFLGLQLNRNPVLQFMQGEQVKQSHVFVNNQFTARLFPPGDYELRLVYDENKNGVWDTGSFFGKKQQPEKVQLIKRKISVKANWENEIDIQL